MLSSRAPRVVSGLRGTIYGYRYRFTDRVLPAASTPCRALSTSDAQQPQDAPPTKPLLGVRLAERLGLDLQSNTLSLDDSNAFNRAKIVVSGMINHAALGSIFAWSVFNAPLARLEGVVAQSPADWSLAQTSWTFSLVMGGFAVGALTARYLDAWGPRFSCSLGALCLASGWGLASVAAATQSLPLLYAGGAVWGIANGVAYVPPVNMLLAWFKNKKGFAGGATIVGFGGGAMLATPLFEHLLSRFRKIPEFVGASDAVDVINHGGRLMVEVGGELKEVVVATAADVAALGVSELQEGAYLLGTGSSGMSETFLCLGGLFSSAMLLSATTYRLPHTSFMSEFSNPASGTSVPNVDPDVALRTPQFAQMYVGFGLSIAGAYGVLSTGKTLLTEAFQTTSPELVTAGVTGGFVAMMSAANLVGRVGWSNMSDVITRRVGDPFRGRKLTYTLMWFSALPCYGAIIWSIHSFNAEPRVMPLAVFCGGVSGVMASFGGSAATRPAFTADVFGPKYVGITTARSLSVVLLAASAGPRIATGLREMAIHDAVVDLANRCDPAVFRERFGCGVDGLDSLVANKAVNIARLMEIMPAGTVDPSPFVFDNMLMVMVAINSLALTSNLILNPVDPKFHEHRTDP